ncbi:uncharacterized protein [Rutidosis leptorrhynchoides]|uniref:uncharacterized protein n=1 Tax=Rutidosis leptorrhynchoides TaxID=125765 RepID=UPI003A9920B0
MPFTTIALDRLIEPKASKKQIAADKNDSRQGSRVNRTDKLTERKHHWNQISPALYATPEPTPLPDSPSSFAPSPYIVDHKRRGPRLSKAYTEDVIALNQAVADENITEIVKSFEAEDVESCSVVDDTDINIVRDTMVNGERENGDVNVDVATGRDNLESVEMDRDSEMDDFFDPQDSMSVRSSIDGGSSCGLERSLNLNSSASEFYDAWEELSSESGSQPSSHAVETELREMRLTLLVEMEKRKQAEECIKDMRSQWVKIREQLSFVGLNLSEDPAVLLQDHSGDDLVDDISRQVHLIRFVSNSIGRGVAKAEVELEMESQLESKNFEIARLFDKLRYYEAVNHEMSQRNQETIETMRRVRQRRKTRQRWVWGSIVAAVTVGSAAALVWSYGKGSSITDHPSSQTSDASRSGSAQ